MTEEEKLAEEQIKRWDNILAPVMYPVALVKDFIRKSFLAGFKAGFKAGLKAGLKAGGGTKWHRVADGDLPELSGEMRAERHCVLAYTESLGWTQAIRRRVGKKKFEWVCSNYDGNTLFFDDEITAWTELPEPKAEGKEDKK